MPCLSLFFCARFNERKQSDTIYQHEEITRLISSANEQYERFARLQIVFTGNCVLISYIIRWIFVLRWKYFPMESVCVKKFAKFRIIISRRLFIRSLLPVAAVSSFAPNINKGIYTVHFYNSSNYKSNLLFVFITNL